MPSVGDSFGNIFRARKLEEDVGLKSNIPAGDFGRGGSMTRHGGFSISAEAD